MNAIATTARDITTDYIASLSHSDYEAFVDAARRGVGAVLGPLTFDEMAAQFPDGDVISDFVDSLPWEDWTTWTTSESALNREIALAVKGLELAWAGI